MLGRATITLGIGPHSSFRFSFYVFRFSVFFAFIVLGLVSSVLLQEIGWKERL